MRVEVLKGTEKELELALDNLTIASLLVHYLRSDERVEFASFNQEHPLVDEIKLFLRVKKDAPRKVLKEVVQKVLSDVSELRENLLSSLS